MQCKCCLTSTVMVLKRLECVKLGISPRFPCLLISILRDIILTIYRSFVPIKSCLINSVFNHDVLSVYNAFKELKNADFHLYFMHVPLIVWHSNSDNIALTSCASFSARIPAATDSIFYS